MQQLAGFPYAEIQFDEKGTFAGPGSVEALVADVAAAGLTDLFIFSHGWNNSPTDARGLYLRFFSQLRTMVDGPGAAAAQAARIGTLGVIWPSIRWLDDKIDALPTEGGAAGLQPVATVAPSDSDLLSELKIIFQSPEQRMALDQMALLLEERPSDDAALTEFQDLMRRLATTQDAAPAIEDHGEDLGLLGQPARVVFERTASDAPRSPDLGGAADLGDIFSSLWDGAKQALRFLTYFEMKKKAGVVGKSGLGPLIGRLNQRQPALRVHLLGHSFGARLVSYALAGLPPGVTSVKSVFLLQGAFSHFAFAPKLPHDLTRAGALAGMEARVDGPLLASFSSFDLAVTRHYPLASIAGQDDSAALEDPLFRWGAIGHDGAQGTVADALSFGPVGQSYAFKSARFTNLDGNQLIVNGGGMSGAHGDIFHPEIAWASLCAANLQH